MSSERDANKAVGIELQIEELVEQRERADVQGRFTDVVRLTAAITVLYDELADVAEHAVTSS
jgi:hypothetical protein